MSRDTMHLATLLELYNPKEYMGLNSHLGYGIIFVSLTRRLILGVYVNDMCIWKRTGRD